MEVGSDLLRIRDVSGLSHAPNLPLDNHDCQAHDRVWRAFMAKKPHTSCMRGKRVRVKLHSGEVIIDKFREGRDRFIILEERGKILVADIDSFGPWRPQPQFGIT